jgi:hypothetical protein
MSQYTERSCFLSLFVIQILMIFQKNLNDKKRTPQYKRLFLVHRLPRMVEEIDIVNKNLAVCADQYQLRQVCARF